MKTAGHIYRYYRGVAVAASMRGHGVMIPFGIHCATISLISHDKVQSFVNDIGRPEWGVEMTEDRRGGVAKGIADDVFAILQRFDRDRPRIYAEVREAQAALLAHTAENFRRFAELMLPRVRGLLHSS